MAQSEVIKDWWCRRERIGAKPYQVAAKVSGRSPAEFVGANRDNASPHSFNHEPQSLGRSPPGPRSLCQINDALWHYRATGAGGRHRGRGSFELQLERGPEREFRLEIEFKLKRKLEPGLRKKFEFKLELEPHF